MPMIMKKLITILFVVALGLNLSARYLAGKCEMSADQDIASWSRIQVME